MKRKFLYCALIALGSVSLVSCFGDEEEDDNKREPVETVYSDGLFVVNAGNYFGNIDGSLTYIDYADSEARQEVFFEANGRSLGANPSDAIVYGGKIYITVQQSDVVEVIDRYTFKSVKQIPSTSTYGTEPRDVVAKDGKVYISMFDGHVARLDTLSLSYDATVKVGPNPEEMAIVGDSLFVVNSDGLNYLNGYENGKTVSKIDLTTFTEVEKIPVGLNPTKAVSNGKDLFVICMGDYTEENPAMVKKVSGRSVIDVCEGTRMAIHGDDLYVLNNPVYDSSIQTLTRYSASLPEAGVPIEFKKVDSPEAMGVDPQSGDIFISSFYLNYGYADYYTPGYINRYDSNGNFKKKYATGVDPYNIVFNATVYVNR